MNEVIVRNIGYKPDEQNRIDVHQKQIICWAEEIEAIADNILNQLNVPQSSKLTHEDLNEYAEDLKTYSADIIRSATIVNNVAEKFDDM